VRGSTKKLFRQKGTGNARAGSIKSPLRRGGGVIFGPKPKNWGYLVPKKVRRLALKMALSAKLSGEKMVVLDKIEMEKPKTKGFLSVAGALDLSSVLFVTAEKNENLELSTRNLKGVKVLRTEGLNVYDILKYEKIVLLEASIKGIEGRLL
jgi:large subunit ribosomal protein L4